MTKRNVLKNKLLIYIVSALLIVMSSYALFLVFEKLTLADLNIEKWDGESISSSFSSGNGSEENPFIINNGADLNYFSSLMNDENYNNLNYMLGNDIDLDNHLFKTIDTFKGSFDGNGHTIYNGVFEGIKKDEIVYNGLFSVIDGGTIKNLNINKENIVLLNTEDSYYVGSLCGKVIKGNIYNVTVSDSKIDLNNGNNNDLNKVGGFIGEVSTDTIIDNVYLDININTNNDNIGKIFYTLDSNVLDIISVIKVIGNENEIDNYKNSSNDSKIDNLISGTKDNDITLDKDINEVITSFNEGLEDYYFEYKDNNIVFKKVVVEANVNENTILPFSFGVNVIALHDSGVVGDTLYVNDLDSDFNHYTGLNYTTTNDGRLPNGSNYGHYNNSNLAKVYMQFNGSDISGDNIGYLSLDEQISKFIYYKYYPVVNGKITIELIDHPFGDRPDNKAFNGWITDDPSVLIRYDKDIHAYIAEYSVSDVSSPIYLTFYASWINASVGEVTRNNNNGWNEALSKLKNSGFYIIGKTPVYENVDNYYVKGTVGRYRRFPNNAIDENANSIGGNRCWSNNGCEYYTLSDHSTYDPSLEYYEIVNGKLEVHNIEIIRFEDNPDDPAPPVGSNAVGYYTRVSIPNGGSLANHYNADGTYISSGNCTNSGGCSVYERIPYYDNSGNVNKIIATGIYYYLVTRDTNIIVLRTNSSVSFNAGVPFTLTAVNNGQNYNTNYSLSSAHISAQADLRIEHVKITSGNGSSAGSDPTGYTNSNGYIYGNFHNLKIGRGVTSSNNNRVARAVIGGNNDSTGDATDLTRYRLVIESGTYNNLTATNGTNTYGNMYVDGLVTYGSDYDRIAKDDSKLDVYNTVAAAWGTNLRSSSDTKASIVTVVKSGKFGSSKNDYTSGIYVGGLNGGTHYSVRSIIVEGGWIYNILGGPLTDRGRSEINDIYINVKGGTVDFIFGGAGRSETYGNRIINVTGGKVNYAVFGGSNGYTGNNQDSYRGTLTGSSFIYIGGNAVIGDDTAINEDNPNYGEEIGSVFGIGNGNSNYTTIGTADNSTVIIDGNAVIKKNVYGGGNYGAVGINASSSTSTNIKILGGTINGSVYGGGNRNGSGSNNVVSTINIEMSSGTINGSVYGGSRNKGVVYGSTNLNIYGGAINTDVYGGGEGGYVSNNEYGTAVMRDVNVNIGRNSGEVLPLTIDGSVYGGSAYGSVNGNTRNETVSSYHTNVTVHYGLIKKSVFGGGKGNATTIPYVMGNVSVTVNDGNITSLFGGNDANGQPNGTDIVYLNGGIIGDAFGGGNNTGQKQTNINLQGAQVVNLFGGSNVLGTVDKSLVNVTSGSVSNVFGGNNVGGSTTNSEVNISGGTINGDVYGGGKKANTGSSVVRINSAVKDVYGGGMEADCTTTHITTNNGSGNNIFGGSNVKGTVNNSTLDINGTRFGAVYGGNNQGGTTATTTLNINSGTITDVIGGGNKALSTISNVNINDGLITNVYGGGNEAGLTTSNVNINGGTVTNVYGGSNVSGDLSTSNVTVGQTVSTENPLLVTLTPSPVEATWQSNSYETYSPVKVKVTNTSEETINNWKIQLNLPADSTIYSNYSSSDFSISNGVIVVDQVNRYDANRPYSLTAGASYEFEFAVLTNTPVADFFVNSKVLIPAGSGNSEIPENNISVTNVYGGNNQGGTTTSTNVIVNYGSLNNLYGGGNLAPVGSTNVKVSNANVLNIYGGGNLAQVSENTYLDIDNSTLNASVYGGGNEGPVLGNTEVFVTDSVILGSLYAGGNGASASVSKNTSVTIDGQSNIGNESSKAPFSGCVFGGGNAAITGVEGEGTSTAIVNIVGGHIYENVYGGANTSVVYGATETNIGSKAVTTSGLKVNNLIIDGTVFGGGESNAEGREEYDYSFKSVIGSIDINIDGTGYIDSGLEFKLTGSIFGSGNASSSEGTSRISVKKLGEKDKPSKNLSFQRADLLTIDNSYMELIGIEDRTNEYSDILYSFNQINSLIIKNNTTLLLQRNANMLKELYSGVDSGGTLVPATVSIDDTNKTVTKNVDNRIYMIPNRSLNVTTNQAATAYGKVTGMTFFGMYNSFSSGSYGYGLYGRNFEYGSAADMSDAIIGGSYVLGLHALSHDITVDGFYTNVLNDDGNSIVTEYIDPTPKDTNFYRWVVGMNAINYTVNLTSTKYSSLGTYTLSLYDFSKGNTIFNVIGFNSEGLAKGTSLVNPADVPRVTDSPEEANQILGLAMKSETREWTSYGVTQFLSEGDGLATGTKEYLTDSQPVAPSLMFYLYHAKNVLISDSLGTVIITLQALEPISPIEYEVKYITITVEMEAKNYDDGDSYDAAITYDKKYDLPSITDVKITNKSQFTAYYSLFTLSESFEKFYGRNNSNTHVLTSNFALPVGTQITMIDYGYDYENPKYYYYDVTEEKYNTSVSQLENENEVTYKLSDFIKMGSTSSTNTYNDKDANTKYYSTEFNRVIEEFIFIFDFKNTTFTGKYLDNSILMELRNSDNRGIISVLGIRQAIMKYSLYDESNSVLVEDIQDLSDYLYNGVSEEFVLNTKIDYDQTENREPIIDTNYESNCMGLNISLYDSSNTPISSSLLQGTVFKVLDKSYFADGDGVFRIKLAGKVSNLVRNMSVVVDKNLPPGIYTMRFVLFSSPDGLHNSSMNKSAVYEKQITVVDDDNALVVACDDYSKIVDGDLVLNKDNKNFNQYSITNHSVLSNPNIRVDLYKRSTENSQAIAYEEVPFNRLFSNVLTSSNNALYPYEVKINSVINSTSSHTFNFQSELSSGTYKLVFRLYDNDHIVDEEIQYVIVTKKIENE